MITDGKYLKSNMDRFIVINLLANYNTEKFKIQYG